MNLYYKHGGISVYHGDCMELLLSMQDNSIDCIITDPPYNIGYNYASYKDNLDSEDYFKWQLELHKQFCRVLRGGGSLFYLHYPEFASRIAWAASDNGLSLYEMICWTYNTHTGGKPLRKGFRIWNWMVKDATEPAYIGENALRGVYRNPTDKRVAARIADGKLPVDYDWWHYEQVKNVSSEKIDHPCQLPLEMVERIVDMGCPIGGVVFEPFMGSGTTPLAAHLNNRHCISIERDEQYLKAAVKRLKAHQAQLNLFIA